MLGKTRSLFVYFRPLLNTMTNIVQIWQYKGIDGVLGIRTWDNRMVGANESNELCVVLKKDKTKLVFLKTYTKRRIANVFSKHLQGKLLHNSCPFSVTLKFIFVFTMKAQFAESNVSKIANGCVWTHKGFFVFLVTLRKTAGTIL